MAQRAESLSPKTFFLNEKHELSREEKTGFGRIPTYKGINWKNKGQSIARSLTAARRKVVDSPDPLKTSRYFLLAKPEPTLFKESKSKRVAPEGTVEEHTNFAERHSQVFRRLGLDLIQVNQDGSATVHAKPERLEQLVFTTSDLEHAGRLEQSRWARLAAFDIIPPTLRVDDDWLQSIPRQSQAETIIELQPLLSRSEIDVVSRSIAAALQNNGGALRGTGTDFSGRAWFRGTLLPRSIRELANGFYSIQSLHAPLRSLAAARTSARRTGQQAATPHPPDPRQLPCVAIVDTGIPEEHRLLASYRRGRYLDPDSAGRALGHHGCRVASRVVFGDVDYTEGLPEVEPIGDCAFFDATVCITDREIEDKAVVRAMDTVIRVAPDVRTFNLSFDSVTPLTAVGEVLRRERLLATQDLDNFIFANDVLVVIAAGNTPQGITPATPYPGHHTDPQWSLGAWARAFNALTCGATVERLSSGGLVGHIGWPSPFTRVGPGTCDAPKPDYAAHGGDFTPEYGFAPGLGVWSCNADGHWEDASGTSLAAPLLARQAAHAFDYLQRACEEGTRPYAVTVKAFLALTANPPVVGDAAKPLAARALGRGRASAARLIRPVPTSAVFLWQGVLDGPRDLARIQIPVPLDWLAEADQPRLRLVGSWDSPVNAAAEDVWACRHVSAQLRLAPDGGALHSSRTAHRSYTTFERIFDLTAFPKDEEPADDLWLLELSYEQIAEYSTAIEFSPQQRAAFAIELFDASEEPVSPQEAVQALPIAATLNRLSVPSTLLRTPFLIRTRV
jgi:hypothetical protein